MTNRLGLPYLGDGVGLRAVHNAYLYNTPSADWGVDWFEVISEDYFDGAGPMLDHIATMRPIVLHGVSLNIGSSDPLNLDYLGKLAELVKRVHPEWISDHLCWTGAEGVTGHDLWPLPRTEACLTHVTNRVQQVQDYLGEPLVLENPSTYLEFVYNTMTEPEFMTRLVQATGCGILLDVNNVMVSSTNHGFNPLAYLDGIPADAVVQIHVAGHADYGTHRLDTHDRAVSPAVWTLYRHAWQRFGPVSTLLEWDTDIPEFPALVAELGKAVDARRW